MSRALSEAKKGIRKQGPCAMCGWHPYAAHRVIDTEMVSVANGASLQSVADEYGEKSVEEMVWRWYALRELLQDKLYKATTATGYPVTGEKGN